MRSVAGRPGEPMRVEAGCGAGRCERRQGAGVDQCERRQRSGRAETSGGWFWGGPMRTEAGCGVGRDERRQGADEHLEWLALAWASDEVSSQYSENGVRIVSLTV